MSISLEEYGFGQNLSEGVLRGLVTHSTNNTQLAGLARVHGYTDGARLGVAVRINHETGAIMGSVMQLYGEDNPVILDIKTPARRLWEAAHRRVDLSIKIRVRLCGMREYIPRSGRVGNNEQSMTH